MQTFETVIVDQADVVCDGGGGVGGHPRVFLNLAASGRVECPYCSRTFVLRRPAEGPAAGTVSPHP